jgi:hypothetical protein
MAAERRGPAALDRRHDFQLAKAHMPCIGQTPSGTVVAEDVRDLQSWRGHQSYFSGGSSLSVIFFGFLRRVDN